MFWWILAIFLSIWIARGFWKNWTHPSMLLARQAANLNWSSSGTHIDENGFRNTKFSKNGMEAIVSFTQHNVQLTNPFKEEPFADFKSLEEWVRLQK